MYSPSAGLPLSVRVLLSSIFFSFYLPDQPTAPIIDNFASCTSKLSPAALAAMYTIAIVGGSAVAGIPGITWIARIPDITMVSRVHIHHHVLIKRVDAGRQAKRVMILRLRFIIEAIMRRI